MSYWRLDASLVTGRSNAFGLNDVWAIEGLMKRRRGPLDEILNHNYVLNLIKCMLLYMLLCATYHILPDY